MGNLAAGSYFVSFMPAATPSWIYLYPPGAPRYVSGTSRRRCCAATARHPPRAPRSSPSRRGRRRPGSTARSRSPIRRHQPWRPITAPAPNPPLPATSPHRSPVTRTLTVSRRDGRGPGALRRARGLPGHGDALGRRQRERGHHQPSGRAVDENRRRALPCAARHGRLGAAASERRWSCVGAPRTRAGDRSAHDRRHQRVASGTAAARLRSR